MLLVLLWLALPYWLPPLLAHWLPAHTRLVLQLPTADRRGITIPQLSYLAGSCQLMQLHNVRLSYADGWRLDIDQLMLDRHCISQLSDPPATVTAFSLGQWQARLPAGRLHIARLTVAGLADYAGALTLLFDPQRQQISYSGKQISLQADLQGGQLEITQLHLTLAELNRLLADQASHNPPVNSSVATTAAHNMSLRVTGRASISLADTGIPVAGSLDAQLMLPPSLLQSLALQFGPGAKTALATLYASLNWQGNNGQLLLNGTNMAQPLLDLPWQVNRQHLKIYDGRWQWWQPQASGRLALNIDNWQQGLREAQISARLNVLTANEQGKANAVLTLAPGRLSDSALSLRLTGQARYHGVQLYASLPAELRDILSSPSLQFLPAALLWSRGQLITGLNIHDARWPLAGIRLSASGINGRLQAILHGHDQHSGSFSLHLDGNASDFLADKGHWRWRYWGKGDFLPLQSGWHTAGAGEWRDGTITLSQLNTEFNQWRYAGLHSGKSRLRLQAPLVWRRGEQPQLSGKLALNMAPVHLPGGGQLPASVVNFTVNGTHPDQFQFTGDWRAAAIGPLRVNGRWDGTRLRGQAWWPAQPLTVLQPLLPPGWHTRLRQGNFYTQIAFSAAALQGLNMAGHAVVKNGAGWLAETEITGVTFTLPFRLNHNGWYLGPRQPVALRVAQINNQFSMRHFTADLQGSYPWRDDAPLTLSNVSLETLGGSISMRQLRLPQYTAALVQLSDIDSSQFISALNSKIMAVSGRVEGVFPLWLAHSPWLIHQGWLSNPAALTLRADADLINGMVASNGAAASVLNWLRYLEIEPHSWLAVNLDRHGKLTLRASVQGSGVVSGQRGSVRLNYNHQDNIFTLWQNLRYGENVKNWLMDYLAPSPQDGNGLTDN